MFRKEWKQNQKKNDVYRFLSLSSCIMSQSHKYHGEAIEPYIAHDEACSQRKEGKGENKREENFI